MDADRQVDVQQAGRMVLLTAALGLLTLTAFAAVVTAARLDDDVVQTANDTLTGQPLPPLGRRH